MTEYLLFRLYGPMASWGEIDIDESRRWASYPSRSALAGLLGAALGIFRNDVEAQRALISGYRFAIKVLNVGTPLRDFHTIQSSPDKRNVVYRTRTQELANKHMLGTLLSKREYRCDSLALVAVEALAGARWTLAEIRSKLNSPIFPLYLGRKSCPPALPLAPVLITAGSLFDVFREKQYSILALTAWRKDKVEAEWPTHEDKRVLGLRHQTVRFHWEDGEEAGMMPDIQITRRDRSLSRRRQFAPRRKNVRLEPENA